jgi:hypothetical protein
MIRKRFQRDDGEWCVLNEDGELVTIEEFERQVNWVNLDRCQESIAQSDVGYFLHRCEDPDFTMADAFTTLVEFDHHFPAKVRTILKYQLRCPDFEYTLTSARGLACIMFVRTLARSNGKRSETAQNQWVRYLEKFDCCGVAEVMDDVLEKYWARLDRQRPLFWDTRFNWNEYWKHRYDYDWRVTRNEMPEKTPEEILIEKQPRTYPKAREMKHAIQMEALRFLGDHPSFLSVKRINESIGKPVSDKTLRNYLDELEKQGKVIRKKEFYQHQGKSSFRYLYRIS